MQTFHFLEVPYAPDEAALLRKNCLAPDSDEAADFLRLLGNLAPRIRPKAAVLAAAVAGASCADADKSADKDGTGIENAAAPLLIGGVPFAGAPLLRRLFAGARTIWLYAATCGREGEAALRGIADPLERFWVDSVLEDALDAAANALEIFFREEFFRSELFQGKTRPAAISSISPESLPAWPIEQQRPLFRLLGAAAEACGITLTESLLMLPAKSVSGIRFPGESGRVTCALCARAHCARRKAACTLPESCRSISGTPS